MRRISRIPRTQIMINPYLYPWWLFINSVILPPKLVTRIRRIKIDTMRDFPFSLAQSVNAEWSGLRYFVWRTANPPTTNMRRRVNILDSGTPKTVGSTTFVSHFSSISSAVKRIMKSHTHWIDGYFSRSFAIQPDATTMRMIETTSPIIRLTTFPWLAHATARTLSSDIATSAMMIVCIAVQKVAHHSFHSSWCSWARISR